MRGGCAIRVVECGGGAETRAIESFSTVKIIFQCIPMYMTRGVDLRRIADAGNVCVFVGIVLDVVILVARIRSERRAQHRRRASGFILD